MSKVSSDALNFQKPTNLVSYLAERPVLNGHTESASSKPSSNAAWVAPSQGNINEFHSVEVLASKKLIKAKRTPGEIECTKETRDRLFFMLITWNYSHFHFNFHADCTHDLLMTRAWPCTRRWIPRSLTSSMSYAGYFHIIYFNNLKRIWMPLSQGKARRKLSSKIGEKRYRVSKNSSTDVFIAYL